MQASETIISPEIYEKCVQFAKASVHSSADKYARRNQFDVEKIVKDIRNGKIAEEITRAACLAKLPNLSEPDYNIYDKKNKSWDPDLKDSDSGIRIAVKSQDIQSAIHFGDSWVFQYNNGKNYDCDKEIFKLYNDKNYVSFVSLNIPKRYGIIKAIVKVNWLHDKKLFKEMKKQNLQSNKVAVYLEDLEKFSNDLFQL
jgi:hypothetical protein